MRGQATTIGIVLGIVLAVSYCCAVPQQPDGDAPQQVREVKEILGSWTEIYVESRDEYFSSLYYSWQSLDGPPPTKKERYYPTLVKFGKSSIEVGPNRKGHFPTKRYQYELNVENRDDTIDLTLLDKEGKALSKHRGIFHLVKDDLLIVCYALEDGPRPERFVSSMKPPSTMVILRRGELSVTSRAGSEPPPE